MFLDGITAAQYKNFLEHGGTIRGEADGPALFGDSPLEESLDPALLAAGFDLPPSSAVEEPGGLSQVLLHGDDKSRAIAYIYANGGTVRYRRVAPGRFEVVMTLPGR